MKQILYVFLLLAACKPEQEPDWSQCEPTGQRLYPYPITNTIYVGSVPIIMQTWMSERVEYKCADGIFWRNV